MKRELILAMLGCTSPLLMHCASGPQPAAEQSVTAENIVAARQFRGDDLLRVALVDLRDGSALFRLSGVKSPITDQVLRVRRQENGGDVSYLATLGGRDVQILIHSQDQGSGSWLVYPPDVAEVSGLRVVEDDSGGAMDTDELFSAHHAQLETGSLGQLERFDRTHAQAEVEAELAAAQERNTASFDAWPPTRVEWNSVPDLVVQEGRASWLLVDTVNALGTLAGRSQTARQFLTATVKEVVLTMQAPAQASADTQTGASFESSVLRLAISAQVPDVHELNANVMAAVRGLPVGGNGRTLQAQAAIDETTVCADSERKHVLVLGKGDSAYGKLSVGDGKAFFAIPKEWSSSHNAYFDPRLGDGNIEQGFRRITVDDQGCRFACGEREVQLQALSGEDKAQLLTAASFKETPLRRPFALARDNASNYYYVDRAWSDEAEPDYRLFVGKAGKLQALKLTQAHADAQSAAFASGDKQFNIGRDIVWTQGKKETKLEWLPVEGSFGLIYQQLGVYSGQSLHLPCDGE